MKQFSPRNIGKAEGYVNPEARNRQSFGYEVVGTRNAKSNEDTLVLQNSRRYQY